MNTKKVYILRGPSGSGKTTWTKKLADKLAGETSETDVQVTVCSADHFFERQTDTSIMEGGGEQAVYEFNISKLPEAHQRCMEAFLRALANGDSVIVVDNTNERRWEYTNYELAARIAGYEVEIVEFVAETVEQIRACVSRNTHGVPLSVIATKAVSMESDTRATCIPVEGV